MLIEILKKIRLKNLIQFNNFVSFICLSKDGNNLYSGNGDKTIKILDLIDNKEIVILRKHDDYISCLCLSLDGNKLFVFLSFYPITIL